MAGLLQGQPLEETKPDDVALARGQMPHGVPDFRLLHRVRDDRRRRVLHQVIQRGVVVGAGFGVQRNEGTGEALRSADGRLRLLDLREGDGGQTHQFLVARLPAVYLFPFVHHLAHRDHGVGQPLADTAGTHVVPEVVGEAVHHRPLRVGDERRAAREIEPAHRVGESPGPFLQEVAQPDLPEPEIGAHGIDDHAAVRDVQFLLGGFDPRYESPGFRHGVLKLLRSAARSGGEKADPARAPVDFLEELESLFRRKKFYDTPFREEPRDRARVAVAFGVGAFLADGRGFVVRVLKLRQFDPPERQAFRQRVQFQPQPPCTDVHGAAPLSL